jgi:CBS domain-containing protein
MGRATRGHVLALLNTRIRSRTGLCGRCHHSVRSAMLSSMPRDRSPLSAADLRRLTARDIMTAAPLTVEPATKLSTAAELMEDRGIQHFPVVSGGRLVSLLAERHLRDAMPSVLTVEDPEARRRYLNVTRVEQVAPKDVPVVGPEASIAEIIALMRKHRLDGVPVAVDGQLAGIVTSGDLITLLERVVLS